jgi:hypothetical protein
MEQKKDKDSDDDLICPTESEGDNMDEAARGTYEML